MTETINFPTVPGSAGRVEDKGDLGFGSIVATDSAERLLNKDGSFNVRRVGIGWLESQSFYHIALTMSWPRFLWTVAGWYLSLNVLFAFAFWLCGVGALVGASAADMGGVAWRAFFFSVETFATIGYGEISPVGVLPHMIMVLESFVALLSQALISGLLFARFSRPTAALAFSHNLLVSPFRGGRAMMFRIANKRNNQLIDLEARVTCSWVERGAAGIGRKFQQLTLDRARVLFFPLAWTIVHPITEDSPLFGLTDADLRARNFEFLIVVSGTDETFSQQVHTRTSYRPEEVAWGAKFRNIFNPPDAHGHLSVNVGRIDEYDVVELPA